MDSQLVDGITAEGLAWNATMYFAPGAPEGAQPERIIGMYAELVYLISGNDMGSESFGRMQLEPGWISRHVGVSEQDAQRLLSELQEAMLIRVARAGGGYEIEVPALIRARDLSVKRAAAGRRGGNPALRKVVTYSAELGA